jgi:hypothetical protein
MAQVNPYNILAFYSYQPSFDEPAPLVCSNYLLSFQLIQSEITAVNSFVLIQEGGAETALSSSIIEISCTTDNGSFATFKALSAISGLSDGKYQFKVVLDATTYYSHPFCVDYRFSSMFENSVSITKTQADSTHYTILVNYLTSIHQGRRTIEIDFGTGYQNISAWLDSGTSTGTINEANAGVGTLSFPVRVTFEFEESKIMKIYTLSYNSTDVVGTTTFTLAGSSSNVANNQYYFLTFQNGNDISDMKLLYQTGYAQKLFIRGYARFNQVIQETRTQNNAKGKQFFNSQTIAEKTLLDFAPVPDYLSTVLSALQNHSAVVMYNTLDGTSVNISDSKPAFEFAPVEADIILKGTFSFESNRSFVSCESNMELCS